VFFCVFGVICVSVADSDVLDCIDAAFGTSPRPQHFTDFTHCCECAEHDELLRSRNRESLVIGDVGNPGWDPICFITADGFAYYFPSLARLALASPARPRDWYAPQLLFHLSYQSKDNRRYRDCTPAQRAAVARFLQHLMHTRATLIDEYALSEEFSRCYEIWRAV
jgi:hypothetical protein